MYEYKAIVTRVIDGDTIEAEVDLGFHVKMNLRFRLARINAPELKKGGDITRAYLITKLLDKEIIIKSFKTDKYGRWLAEVFIEGENINDSLVKEGLASKY